MISPHPPPPTSLYAASSFADFEAEIWSSWLDQTTDVQGVSTGWKSLDSLYRVRRSLTLATVCGARIFWPRLWV